MAGKTCRVSFRDGDGVRHSVDVEAETLYEAAALALKRFKKSEWIGDVGAGTRIDIEIIEPPVSHFLLYGQLQTWLNGGAKTPAEAVKKKKLKELLAS